MDKNKDLIEEEFARLSAISNKSIEMIQNYYKQVLPRISYFDGIDCYTQTEFDRQENLINLTAINYTRDYALFDEKLPNKTNIGSYKFNGNFNNI